MPIFTYFPHPRAERRAADPPRTVADHHARGNRIEKFNATLAIKITQAVGSMWMAYAFTALALFGLPTALSNGLGPTVQWVAQTFLQLVLLSVILLGQNIQAQASDHRAQSTWEDAEAVLHEARQIQQHLGAQDALLEPVHARIVEGRRRIENERTDPA